MSVGLLTKTGFSITVVPIILFRETPVTIIGDGSELREAPMDAKTEFSIAGDGLLGSTIDLCLEDGMALLARPA